MVHGEAAAGGVGSEMCRELWGSAWHSRFGAALVQVFLLTKGLEEDELPPCVAAQPGFWLCNEENILCLCADLRPASWCLEQE